MSESAHKLVFHAKIEELSRLLHDLIFESIDALHTADEMQFPEMEPLIDLLILMLKKMKRD